MNEVIQYKNYFIRATEYAAIACSKLRGCQDNNLADQAAVNAMRSVLMKSPIDSKIAIGEGEIDEAPMLYIGEMLGTCIDNKDVMPLDIAVDPLECTKNCALNNPNAMTVMAVSPRNNLFSAPDTYMNKLVSNNKFKDRISIDNSIDKNIDIIQSISGKAKGDIKVIVLDRPRNQYIVDALQKLGINIEMISDGDIAASLRVATGEAELYMGIGSAPEGVIAATAVKGLGGHFDGQLYFHSDEAKKRALKMSGISSIDKIDINRLCKSDNSIFVATGVCDGWIPGVKINGDKAYTSTVLIDVRKSKFINISNSYSIKEVESNIYRELNQ